MLPNIVAVAVASRTTERAMLAQVDSSCVVVYHGDRLDWSLCEAHSDRQCPKRRVKWTRAASLVDRLVFMTQD